MSFQASSAKIHYEPGSWQEVANDIYTGTVVGAAHSIYLVAKWWYVNFIRPVLQVFGLSLAKDKLVESADGEKTLKVVAVGYGRTGTVSLRHGLHCPNFHPLVLRASTHPPVHFGTQYMRLRPDSHK